MLAGEVEELARQSESPLERAQRLFHPWSSFAVLPLFALANSGITLTAEAMQTAMRSPVAFGVFLGLRGAGIDPWERVLWVFAVLMLASITMSGRPPAPPFWMASFLMKPNHGSALGLVALAVGFLPRPRPPVVALGIVLALLAWASLMHWVYVLPGIALFFWRHVEDRAARVRLA